MVSIVVATRAALLIARRRSRWAVEQHLRGRSPECVAVDPRHPTRMYCVTAAAGLFRSLDGGRNWEFRDIAADLDSVPFLQARGHHEIENRVARAFEKIVAAGEFFFRSRSNGVRLADLIEFNWEMVSPGGDVKAVGLAFVLLDTDERIRLDDQFIERGETS